MKIDKKPSTDLSLKWNTPMAMLFGLMLLICLCTSFKLNSGFERINWLTIEEAIELNESENRKIIFYVTTKWCASCRKMEASTFTNPSVVKYINENFYPVQFDAESTENITLNNELYEFNSNIGKRGAHSLALYLTNGRLVYPTTTILDERFENPQPVFGFLNGKDIDLLLKYFGGSYHKTIAWEVFNQIYNVN